MEKIASYLLCVESGVEPTRENIENVLGSVSTDYDREELNDFLSKIDGKTYEQIIADGSALMAVQTSAATNNATTEKNEVVEKVEEEEEEEEEVIDFDGFF